MNTEKDMTPGTKQRYAVIEEITRTVCSDRNLVHGDAEDNFALIANYWSLYLKCHVSAIDVANMMVLFKLARMTANAQHRDNYIDLAGYAVCGAAIGTKYCNLVKTTINP